MDLNLINTRSEAREFARRTRKNLEFIETSKEKGADVHIVIQLTLSLLGIIVFPKEKLLLDKTKETTITAMENEGWHTWTITLDEENKPTATLYDIIYHLRNAVAHGRLTFDSDSPQMEEVTIFVEDNKPNNPEPYWCANINAKDLRTFCVRLLDLIDDITG